MTDELCPTRKGTITDDRRIGFAAPCTNPFHNRKLVRVPEEINAESDEGGRILALLGVGADEGFDSGADEGGMGIHDGLTMGGFPSSTEEELDDLALRLRVRDRLRCDGHYLREHFPISARWWWQEPPYKDPALSPQPERKDPDA